MNNVTFKTKPVRLAMLLAGIGMAPVSYAVDLAAVEGTWNGITMWGFTSDPAIAHPTTGVCPPTPPTWSVGPQLTDTDLVAGNLTINLRNCLSEGVSIIIPGQPATLTPVRVNGRVTAFTTEAPADAGATTTAYTWTGVKDGTYLYQSGSHPAKQVQMGLYGALTIGGYPGTSGDVTLLYSEIDPALHSPPTAATPLGYHPRHYLVNGSEGPVSLGPTPTDGVGALHKPTVLRMLNAGLDFHVPALNGGYMSLVAEDGNAYPFPKQQYSANLAAGKTIDALWQPAKEGDHVIYDRRGNGMVVSLSVEVPVNTPPMAANDVYNAVEGVQLDVLLPGVLGNDTDANFGDVLTVNTTPTVGPSKGTLTLKEDGSFSYTPIGTLVAELAFYTDSFTYEVCDDAALALCDTAVVTINVTQPTNTAQEAVADVIPDIVEDSGTLILTESSSRLIRNAEK